MKSTNHKKAKPSDLSDLSNIGDTSSSRVLSYQQAVTKVHLDKQRGEIVGLCHGCFDLLHTGHLRHLEAASQACDRLYVSVTGDAYVNKGEGRPLFPDLQRADLLSGLRVVDYAFINQAASACDLLRDVRPHIFFKGQEYELNGDEVNPNFALEHSVADELSIKVLFTYEETNSSTALFHKYQDGQ